MYSVIEKYYKYKKITAFYIYKSFFQKIKYVKIHKKICL